MNYNQILKYIDSQKIKAVESINFEKKKIKYSEKITGWNIDKLKGDEELVRAYLITKLVNELGYKEENIEIEKEYDIGRPKTNKPRIDIIVRDDKGNGFLFIELKSPKDFEKDKDETIEKQLFNLASQEKGQGNKVNYLTLYTIETNEVNIKDKCILIDYKKFDNFDFWSKNRDYLDELPERYGKPQKEPFVKSGKKDLELNFTHEQLDSLRINLHNVLWGGGGTADNDIFSSLVNIILAKIQDESEKKKGEKYDFQIFSYKDGKSFESNEKLFDRINELYRRALIQRLNINDKKRINKSYVVDENKFSLNKIKYTVSELERFSFVGGKNSFKGKDILGDFFEGIIRQGFKQTKGQFFTHINIVRFMLWGLQLDKFAIEKVNKENELLYVIDPSAGSGTFLIEFMKFITENIKRKYKNKLNETVDIEDKFNQWFLPDARENRWAAKYVYGVEHSFDLGTATKVNMILHGDGSSNIFVQDGLLPFSSYSKEESLNKLSQSKKEKSYYNKELNEQFDVIITNPPFNVDLDKDTKQEVTKEFIFGDKKNSENLFIERWYQLLKPNGRFGAILPESFFDVSDNKYIRIYLYKYFKIKSVISLPQLTFQPFTSTKTSLLFAQKKTKEEIKIWENLWNKYSNEWNILKTRVQNLLLVYIDKKNRDKLTSINKLSEKQEKEILVRFLKDYSDDLNQKDSPKDLVLKFEKELRDLCKYDSDTKNIFGFVNNWWVFSEVSKDINYQIFMSETENVGYKRTLRSEKLTVNDLYRTDKNGEIEVGDKIKETALDYLREIKWD